MYLLVAECPESGLPQAWQFDHKPQCVQAMTGLERSGWKNVTPYERRERLTNEQLRAVTSMLMAVLAKSARDGLEAIGIKPFPVPTGHVVDRV